MSRYEHTVWLQTDGNDRSFLAGSLPLTLNLSPRSLKLLTALGTGVLVGTALIVIIPEGVEMLYSADGSSHRHDKRALAGQEQVQWTNTFGGEMGQYARAAAIESVDYAVTADPVGFKPGTNGGPGTGKPGKAPSLPSLSHDDEDDHDEDEDHDDDKDSHDPHAYVGLSIIFGFILMYLIDNLPKYITSPSQPRRFQINLTSLSFNRASTSASEADGEGDSISPQDEAKASSTTVGLVIHAAADGIALGASSTSSSSLNFIIFIALMVHKAPAAFGLTSVLLKQGLGKRAARAHLIIFSLAAPVGALLTWVAAHLLGFASFSKSTSTEFVTGILLLFSGGTFLYVAMHTMQEAPEPAESHTNGFVEGSMGVYEPPQAKTANSEGLTNIGVTVLGMLLPLLTQFGHVH